jgi:hypothetical protein
MLICSVHPTYCSTQSSQGALQGLGRAVCCCATPSRPAWFRGMHAHAPQQHAANPTGPVPGSACPLGAPWPLSSACSITNVYLITCAGSRAV